jgi:hypothetical protein
MILELIRLAPNETRAHELAARLSAFDDVTMPKTCGAEHERSNSPWLAAETTAVFQPRIC